MMTLIQYVDGDPHVLDATGEMTRQTQFFCKTKDVTIDGNGRMTAFPLMEMAHNADPIYLMDTGDVFMFDEEDRVGLKQ